MTLPTPGETWIHIRTRTPVSVLDIFPGFVEWIKDGEQESFLCSIGQWSFRFERPEKDDGHDTPPTE